MSLLIGVLTRSQERIDEGPSILLIFSTVDLTHDSCVLCCDCNKLVLYLGNSQRKVSKNEGQAEINYGLFSRIFT